MNYGLKIVLAAMVLIGVPEPALFAEPVELKNLEKGKYSFDDSRGYIYLHASTRQVGTFLKVPDKEDIASYERDWEEAFEKAHKKYLRRLKNWEKRKELAAKTNKKIREQPEEPTRQKFSIGSIYTRNSVFFGPDYVFDKDKKAGFYSYLQDVNPGTYIYYGPIYNNVEVGMMGTCYCMGSVQFEVKPGIVTNLGNFLLAAPDFDSLKGTAMPADINVPTGFSGVKVRPVAFGTTVDYTVPESLVGYSVEEADFRASGKIENHFGVTVSRLPKISGVLDYQRDTVIDLKASATKAPVEQTLDEQGEALEEQKIVNGEMER